MEFSANRKSAVVEVPVGAAKVRLEFLDPRGVWQQARIVSVVPGKMRFRIPGPGTLSWRAVLLMDRKFPAAFYSGISRFPPVKSSNIIFNGSGRLEVALLQNLGIASMDATFAAPAAASPAPVEADIWQVDGDTVYYFNQLRGLQVLDLKNPADPRLLASLRLAAVGQDLYLLAGSGSVRHLILLTAAGDQGERTRINLVKVQGRKAEITHFTETAGNLADSRLIGSRLVVITKNRSHDECHLTEWKIMPGGNPAAAGETIIQGARPIIAAGSDWLAVTTEENNQQNSLVTVFALRESGLLRLHDRPVRTAGLIADQYKIQWHNHTLTTISEKRSGWPEWSIVTVLENFSVPLTGEDRGRGVQRLGQLELAKGESLFASRFSGKLAYIVTFLETDPLWIVDLSDPKNPGVSGHLEVPGWSTHLEPVGDLLFSIGWESGMVAASLFDVADPAKPSLIRRLNLGAESEAAWDEKALNLLPELGLAMVPLARYDRASGVVTKGVQLLDLDLPGRDLRARGFIPHDFDARRAAMAGETVVSISQRGMVTADIKDRDKPTILAEVALAWPVDIALDAGKFIIQLETGIFNGGGDATARVSTAGAAEEILSEIPLGGGTVRAAGMRGAALYVLRETGSYGNYGLWWNWNINPQGRELHLDVYDTSGLPVLRRVGSASKRLSANQSIANTSLLWPRGDRLGVLLDSSEWFGFGGWIQNFPIMIGSPFIVGTLDFPLVSIPVIVSPPQLPTGHAPELLTFDVSKAHAPVIIGSIPLGDSGTRLTGAGAAADGLVVVGTSFGKYNFEANAQETAYHAKVIVFQRQGPPIAREGIDLPGPLFEVTRLDRKGFLAYTRAQREGTSEIQVCASDGMDAFLVAMLAIPSSASVAASGQRLFVSQEMGIARYMLGETGSFIAGKPFEIGWAPTGLRCTSGVLIANQANRLFAADVSGASPTQWHFGGWSLRAAQISVDTAGDLLVPFGDHGLEKLQRR